MFLRSGWRIDATVMLIHFLRLQIFIHFRRIKNELMADSEFKWHETRAQLKLGLSHLATGGQMQQAVASQKEVGLFWSAADAVQFILRRNIVGNVERWMDGHIQVLKHSKMLRGNLSLTRLLLLAAVVVWLHGSR